MSKATIGMNSVNSDTTNLYSDVWLTPPSIIKALGEFDLDPCSPINRPWDTALHHYTKEEDGLFLPWFGRVWLNPPYNRSQINDWMHKMAMHGNGIALLFARTETVFFQNYIFPFAHSLLFIAGRVSFYNVDGTRSNNNGGAPSVLISYGEHNADVLADSKIKGKHIQINHTPVVVVGISPSWKCVVEIAFVRLNGKANLQQIYDLVERIAPDKLESNKHHKEKIRQTLQSNFSRISKGFYSLKQNAA
ncbi:MAG: DNA N-6-adenine-methyltransferase [Chitinophagales bacterium]